MQPDALSSIVALRDKGRILQEEEQLDVLPAAATSCMAEAEAFLQVAEYTIKEARSRVVYLQAWPDQQFKTA